MKYAERGALAIVVVAFGDAHSSSRELQVVIVQGITQIEVIVSFWQIGRNVGGMCREREGGEGEKRAECHGGPEKTTGRDPTIP